MATNSKRLYKTKEGSVLGGVCKGFAEVYDFDVSLVRIIYILLTIFVVGSPLIIYLIFYLVLPDKHEVIKQDASEDYTIDQDDYIY